MPIAPALHALLLCPESRTPLLYLADLDALFAPASRLLYPIEGTVPVMVIDEARRVPEAEARELAARGVAA
jgi:uncharacterized protein YbaR (Trm112 family)